LSTSILSPAVPDAEVERILRSLGLTVTSGPDRWLVDAPTFRVDLLREVDLIEEVARHHGFDKLDPTFPPVTVATPPPDPRIPRDNLVRQVLTAAGLSEAVTFGFIEAQAAQAFWPEGDVAGLVGVANPLSATGPARAGTSISSTSKAWSSRLAKSWAPRSGSNRPQRPRSSMARRQTSSSGISSSA
jgi:phenylalanyl-tRNA synthetase beta subunit